MSQDWVLYDKKWLKFLRRTWLFKYIPFVDLALAAGSMATGNVTLDSDFDVIIGARVGRIFTARFFCVLAFGLFGWRRRKLDHREAAADKICLNHFITPASYRLSPPHNTYWQNLYKNLVPVFGNAGTVAAFWRANADWLGEVNYQDDLRHQHRQSAWPKKIWEFLLTGALGNRLEALLRRLQVKRIEASIKTDVGFKPRIKYGDDELEFHPDTARIYAIDQS